MNLSAAAALFLDTSLWQAAAIEAEEELDDIRDLNLWIDFWLELQLTHIFLRQQQIRLMRSVGRVRVSACLSQSSNYTGMVNQGMGVLVIWFLCFELDYFMAI